MFKFYFVLFFCFFVGLTSASTVLDVEEGYEELNDKQKISYLENMLANSVKFNSIDIVLDNLELYDDLNKGSINELLSETAFTIEVNVRKLARMLDDKTIPLKQREFILAILVHVKSYYAKEPSMIQYMRLKDDFVTTMSNLPETDKLKRKN
ncbi:MAG: hypothetical protein COA86_17510 [Kangiella sp.]|nr:MAG: hypothetical protein COA86_17510 [Kangiella sp.]